MFIKNFPGRVLPGVIAGLGLMVALSACNKKERENDNVVKQEETSYANEQLMLEQIYHNADRVVERVFTLGVASLGTCVGVQYDTTANHEIERLTINFGKSACLGYDGRYRKGKIIIEYTKDIKRNTNGHYSKMMFDGYVLDDHTVAGHREIWCKGINESGNLHFDIASMDTITTSKGEMVTGASFRERELYMGTGTLQTTDDKYRITGYGNFIGANKTTYRVEIARPLVDALDCNWINQGVINIFPTGSTQRVLDFGEGECESVATINVNGVITEVKIP